VKLKAQVYEYRSNEMKYVNPINIGDAIDQATNVKVYSATIRLFVPKQSIKGSQSVQATSVI